MSGSPFTYIPESAVQEIAQIGVTRAPREACGVLLPECHAHEPHCASVVELPNLAEEEKCYEVSFLDVAEARRFYEKHPWLLPEEINDGYFLWHTHLGGTQGPSVGDLRYRIVGVRYLVVCIPDPSHGDRKPIAARY